MRLAVSRDGLAFLQVNEGRPVFRSSLGDGLVRDPSIIEGPDGRFHAVWTTGWWQRGQIGLAHSDDLLTWTEPQAVPVMQEFPSTLNCWAPEIHWDPEREQYLIIWSSTVRGMFERTAESSENGPDNKGLNHRMFAVATTDFVHYTPTRLFYDGGFNVIDGMISSAQHEGGWVMVMKDESLRPKPQKNLRLAFSSLFNGPYTDADAAFTPEGVWCEGPTLLCFGDEWRVYFDRYRENRWGMVSSPDLKTWTDRSAEIRVPQGARHGSPFVVESSRLPWLESFEVIEDWMGNLLVRRGFLTWPQISGRQLRLRG